MTNDRRTTNKPPFRLMERDLRILADLYLHRAISRDQLIGLGHFNSVPRCNSRINRLIQAGLARRIYPQSGSGSQAIYSVGPGATSILVARVNVPKAEVAPKASRAVPPLFLAHTLGLVDLRVAFQRQAQTAGFSIEVWLPEPSCRHEYSIKDHPLADWRRHVLKPDAYVKLSKEGRSRHYFLELDLGHVSHGQFAKKVDSYRRYLDLGLFTEVYAAKTFGVLVVTTGDHRLCHLHELTTQTAQPRFLFTTQNQIQKGLFRRCWIGPEGTTSIVPGDHL